MEEKQIILEQIMPAAVLKAITPSAEHAIPQTLMTDGLVCIRTFPFRVGRESRVKMIDGKVERVERVKYSKVEASNELYLVDDGHLLNISREHFQIEKDGDRYYVYDRGSACGTRNGDEVAGGGDTDGTIELKDGDIITVGTKNSPYRYQFILLDQYEVRLKEDR